MHKWFGVSFFCYWCFDVDFNSANASSSKKKEGPQNRNQNKWGNKDDRSSHDVDLIKRNWRNLHFILSYTLDYCSLQIFLLFVAGFSTFCCTWECWYMMSYYQERGKGVQKYWERRRGFKSNKNMNFGQKSNENLTKVGIMEETTWHHLRTTPFLSQKLQKSWKRLERSF